MNTGIQSDSLYNYKNMRFVDSCKRDRLADFVCQIGGQGQSAKHPFCMFWGKGRHRETGGRNPFKRVVLDQLRASSLLALPSTR